VESSFATVTATEDEGAAEEGVLVVPNEALDPDHVTGLT